jgi:membrane protein implicated in regulation of membrane protease activity
MSQSRTMSLVESIANVLAGFGVAVAMQIAVFPLFGLRTSLAENLAMGAIFTLVSIVRSYCLRRVFERIRARAERSNTAGHRCLGGALTGLFKRSGRSVRVLRSSRTPR